jgi:monoamine oxidase
VLEARDRIGGRICTNHDFGCPIDLGASWLHDHCPSNPISVMAKTLNFRLRESDDDGEILNTNGQPFSDKHTTKLWEKFEDALLQVASSFAASKSSSDNRNLELMIANQVSRDEYLDPIFQLYMSNLDFDLGTSINKVDQCSFLLFCFIF